MSQPFIDQHIVKITRSVNCSVSVAGLGDCVIYEAVIYGEFTTLLQTLQMNIQLLDTGNTPALASSIHVVHSSHKNLIHILFAGINLLSKGLQTNSSEITSLLCSLITGAKKKKEERNYSNVICHNLFLDLLFFRLFIVSMAIFT